jgi:ribosomal protein RSM22 (predicted rRNA methylase)
MVPYKYSKRPAALRKYLHIERPSVQPPHNTYGSRMLLSRSSRPICCSCRTQLFLIFRDGFSSNIRPKYIDQKQRTYTVSSSPRRRAFNEAKLQTRSVSTVDQVVGDHHEADVSQILAEREAIVRKARQTFGHTLPSGLLSHEEFLLYERLYGLPLSEPHQPEEIDPSLNEDGLEVGDNGAADVLLRENADGSLEEVAFDDETDMESHSNGKSIGYEAGYATIQDSDPTIMLDAELDGLRKPLIDQEELPRIEAEEWDTLDEHDAEEESQMEDEYDEQDGAGSTLRAHPLTTAGKFSTSPTTLQFSQSRFINPVKAMLAGMSNKHLVEAAHRTFGGPGLPNSTATPSSKGHLQQQPIALEASQHRLSEIEADMFMAAIMPGAYAAVMSVLVECRRRLGSKWLEGLLRKPGGPRVLDAGAGGAGVLAWRELLQADWQRIHSDDSVLHSSDVPFGKATVITGSPELRLRASQLLVNTTFLPRIPDYHPARDLPAPPEGEPPSRKIYDVVIAPHTLWTLKEDHMRKAHVQNLWSLLDPNGGVLILVEKGVPRGFELIAGARETLLKNQISSPGSREKENELQDPGSRYYTKEAGMIIAPCTNHEQCPMYKVSGASKGRKDYCHFSQRFIRPSYLQQLLGAKDRNHEDIRFSYIAVQRGRDLRLIENFEQGDGATETAFKGYHETATEEFATDNGLSNTEEELIQPHMLSLPRTLAPPLKRRGHVTMDVCTPSGQLERWTVPKSFGKQAYRDARKAKWGDLWALGAKTRVLRQARVGASKNKSTTKRVYQVNVGADESQDTVKEVTKRTGQYKERYKRMKKGPKPTKIRDIED